MSLKFSRKQIGEQIFNDFLAMLDKKNIPGMKTEKESGFIIIPDMKDFDDALDIFVKALKKNEFENHFILRASDDAPRKPTAYDPSPNEEFIYIVGRENFIPVTMEDMAVFGADWTRKCVDYATGKISFESALENLGEVERENEKFSYSVEDATEMADEFSSGETTEIEGMMIAMTAECAEHLNNLCMAMKESPIITMELEPDKIAGLHIICASDMDTLRKNVGITGVMDNIDTEKLEEKTGFANQGYKSVFVNSETVSFRFIEKFSGDWSQVVFDRDRLEQLQNPSCQDKQKNRPGM